MSNKYVKHITTRLLPNWGIAGLGLILALFSWSALCVFSRDGDTHKFLGSLIWYVLGIVICSLPFMFHHERRKWFLGLFTCPIAVKIYIFLGLAFACQICEAFNDPHSSYESFTTFSLGNYIGHIIIWFGCIVAGLSCIAGIIVGAVTFFMFLFNDEILWEPRNISAPKKKRR